MNYTDRVVLIDGASERECPASIVLVSATEAEGVFSITDVSIRVPVGFPVLPTTGEIRVETGPLVGTYKVTQPRPNRQHSRYICTRLA